MAKQFFFDTDARRELEGGVRKLAKVVRTTLGPSGRSVILEKKFGSPTIAKDGVTIARDVELVGPFENMGAKLLSEVASRTHKEVGDGTATAVVLAEAMLSQGRRYVDSGVSPIALRNGIDKAVARAEQAIQEMATTVQGRKDIQNVGYIAANHDAEIGKLLADAMGKVGIEGVIKVEENDGVDTVLDIVDGLEFDKGFISPYFVTHHEEMVVRLEKPQVLITDRKISSIMDLVPILEKVLPSRRPLLIVAEDLEGEALAGLIINRLRGTLEVAAIKAPGFGDRRKAMLEDLAVLTGGTFLSKDLGFEWDSVKPEDLGRCKSIEVFKDKTVFFTSGGVKESVEARKRQISAQIERTTSSYDREKLEERLAKLEGKIALIRVGAYTEFELKERKTRVEGALNSTRSAVEEGIVPGGATAFIRAIPSVLEVSAPGDAKFGVIVVAEALRAPLAQIGDNLGMDGPAVVAEVEDAKGNHGFNALKGKVEDLLEAGIIDPAKVVRLALRNAASIAALSLISDTAMTDIPKGKEPVAGAVS